MNAKQKSMIVGAVLGAALGIAGGYLFTRGLDVSQAEAKGSQQLSLRAVPPGEIVKLFIAVMAVLRGVAELGERL
jgi:hypothetical protein